VQSGRRRYDAVLLGVSTNDECVRYSIDVHTYVCTSILFRHARNT
jgi:hypothetical protein